MATEQGNVAMASNGSRLVTHLVPPAVPVASGGRAPASAVARGPRAGFAGALLRAALLAAVLATILACPAGVMAQDFPGWDPEFGTPILERRLSIGIDVGKPLVFGLTGGYQFNSRAAGLVGVAALGDFTALNGELRVQVTHFEMAMPVPYLVAGFTQYYLSDGPAETSPITAHAAVGTEYVFTSFFAIGAELGYMEALGGSHNAAVDRYGISDDVASLYFSLGGRYLF